MRIPLIVGWDARLNKRGPTVSLQPGLWAIRTNHKAAKPSLCTDEPAGLVYNSIDSNLVFEGGRMFYIHFTPECKETGISIYAEKQ